ncbi:C40 family peptidase [Streptomyces sp. UNOC14_S4]|uniref:C40 family peptidase n=1 Tax=Streptomyces sp. UNOC14_S4 TaxID=2872340 RepID=UPI001E617E4C|nr:C40 family peptidase [Streptomyces sp. UNOC14_S4]MCC3768097.1 C40 family peptidase [Streptomyces sp. UNOC14_S4]
MSPNAHITSHRKPRRTATQSWVVRTGVAGGVLSTLAVAGAGSATAAEKPTEATMEMPAINATIASSIAQSAAATQQTAFGYQESAQQDHAADAAKDATETAKNEALRIADAAEKKAAAEKQQREQDESRASRGGERTSLSAKSASADSSDEAGDSSSSSSSSSSSHVGSGSVSTLISFLENQLGKAYVMGATGSSAYDCSGLVMKAYAQLGIDLPRVSQDQSAYGTQVSLSNLQQGDILYWGSSGSAYHVAIYVGGGKFIGAQNPSSGVVERDLSYDMPTGAVRVL